MTGFTPAPWVVFGIGEESILVADNNPENDLGVCEVNFIPGTLEGPESIEQALADARLISAAPELLGNLIANNALLYALWEVESNLITRKKLEDQMTTNSIAIAKATEEP